MRRAPEDGDGGASDTSYGSSSSSYTAETALSHIDGSDAFVAVPGLNAAAPAPPAGVAGGNDGTPSPAVVFHDVPLDDEGEHRGGKSVLEKGGKSHETPTPELGEASRADEGEKPVNPYTVANIFSIMTFSWITSLMSVGYKRPLDFGDIWKLPDQSRSEKLVGSLETSWADEVASGTPSLSRALRSTFGRRWLMGALPKIFADAASFGPSMVQVQFLRWLDDEDATMGRGYMLASLFLIVPIIQSLCTAGYFHITWYCALDVRSALRALVYAKSLRLSASARASATAGQITNLMAIDAEKVSLFLQMGMFLFFGVVQIIVCIALLVDLLGPSGLAGVGLMFVLVPIQIVLGKKLILLSRAVIQFTDARIRRMSELFASIKVIKLYAWEPLFQDEVLKIRSKELAQLITTAYVSAGNTTILLVTPALVAATVVAFYAGVAGKELRADIIFPALSLFNIMRFPLSFYPRVMHMAAEAHVSLQRLEAFMLLSEAPGSSSPSSPSPPSSPSSPSPQAAPGRNGAAGRSPPNASTAVWLTDATCFWRDPEAAEEPLAALNRREEQRTAAGGGKGGKGAGDGKTTTAAGGGPEPDEVANRPVLRQVNLEIARGELVAVIGAVGCGKSSLLSAVLGELCVRPGSAGVSGRVAYVPQTAWIQNAKLKDNVTFGLPFDAARYRRAVYASALTADLEALPAGDDTEIGERGINLSGGQRQRVSLARAVYADADVYLLDDPLSAVDTHVSSHIFNECVAGALRGKTRVLVTHQVDLARKCDRVLVMGQGYIAEAGTHDELVARGGAYAQLVRELGAGTSNDAGDKGNKDAAAASAASPALSAMTASPALSAAAAGDADGAGGNGGGSGGGKRTYQAEEVQASKHLITKEGRDTGKVGNRVYTAYLRAAGGVAPSIAALLIFYGLTEASRVAGDWWVSFWTSESTEDSEDGSEGRSVGFYLGVYLALTIAQGLLTYVRSIVVTRAEIRAARELHITLLDSILHAPMAFFDTTPAGRVLNRFSKDTDDVDKTLIMVSQQFLNTAITILGTAVLISVSNPWFLLPLVVVAVLYYKFMQFFRTSSREVKRLDSISRSPVFSTFQECLNGLPVIRAYHAEARFVRANSKYVDENAGVHFATLGMNRWVAIRLEFLAALITFSVAFLAVVNRDGVDPSLIGLSITYALSVTVFLMMAVRFFSDFENTMSSVERVHDFATDVAQEPPYHLGGAAGGGAAAAVATQWPSDGAITFRDVDLRYRPDLPLVLRGVSLDIRGGERVAVCGRTGSGKSTLLASLFRLVDPASGSVSIDGVDLTTRGVGDVRSVLTAIPQEAVLFRGTIRSNIDPFSLASDADLWDSLRKCGLEIVVGQMGGLDATVGEDGEGLSVGQRQLVCLARALVRRSKVLVLDEASSSLDHASDRVVQLGIRRDFAGCTIICVAHRVNTIIDYDRVVVMRDGRVVENDTPSKLLRLSGGEFRSMVKELGDDMFDHLCKIADGKIRFDETVDEVLDSPAVRAQ